MNSVRHDRNCVVPCGGGESRPRGDGGASGLHARTPARAALARCRCAASAVADRSRAVALRANLLGLDGGFLPLLVGRLEHLPIHPLSGIEVHFLVPEDPSTS